MDINEHFLATMADDGAPMTPKQIRDGWVFVMFAMRIAKVTSGQLYVRTVDLSGKASLLQVTVRNSRVSGVDVCE